MKKKIFTILAILVVFAVFVLIGGSLGGDHLTTRRAVGNQKIYIGVFQPLTGYLAGGGNQETLGLEYARSQRPTVEISGTDYDIEFVTADNKSEATAAENAALYLADMGVSAVLGSYGCTVSAAGGAVFDRSGIPAIGISCTSPSLTSDFANYYSVCYGDEFQGSVLATFASGQGHTRAAVLTQAGDIYSRGLGRYFSDEFTRLGGEVVDFSFNNVQMNFEDLIAEIKASKADCVFMPSAASSGEVFISQARQNGLYIPIIGADNWDTQTMLSYLGSNGRNVYLASPFSAEDVNNEKGSGFAVKYSAWVSRSVERLEQNGGSSYTPPVAALAYDAYMILCDAIEAAGSTDPASIGAQLKTVSHSGVTGEIKFIPGSEAGQSTAYIKTIDIYEREFALVKTYLGIKGTVR